MPAARLLASTRILLLLSAVLLVLAATMPESRARAAGGAIRVLESRQEIDFPNGVGLSVTAESDTDIVEVRVFFRAAGSRTWGYSYADFQPGSRVVATKSIPDGETAYLAPGVDVEYYFLIRDAHGSTLKTERNRVEYLDWRYDWKRINVGPLELVYHDISASRVSDTANQLQRDLERVTGLLQLEPRKPFKGVLYNSYRDANAVFPQQSQTTTDHGTFAGYAFPEQGVFVGQGLDRRIIVHESAHLLLREAVGKGAVDVPAWLDEGFATYVEPNVRIRSSGDLYHRTPPLKGMNSVSGTPRTIPLFYYKSVSVVAYLIEEYGEDNFRLLLEHLAHSDSIEKAMIAVYGFDVEGLDRRWAGLPVASIATPAPEQAPSDGGNSNLLPTQDRPQQEEGAQTGRNGAAYQPTPLPPGPSGDTRQPGGNPSPFIFFDVWILAGVAILVVVVLAFRLVWSRLHGNADPSDANWDGQLDDGWDDR